MHTSIQMHKCICIQNNVGLCAISIYYSMGSLHLSEFEHGQVLFATQPTVKDPSEKALCLD